MRLKNIKKWFMYNATQQLKKLHKVAQRIIYKKSNKRTGFNYFPAYVTSGRYKAKDKVIKWNDIFHRKIDKTFFPGSLNLILNYPIMLKYSKAYKFANRYLLWEGMLNNETVYLMRWDTCPLHIIEVLSPHNLRNRLSLKDDDIIYIRINSEYISSLRLTKKIAWWILWKKREHLYYLSDLYCNIIRKHGPLRYLRHLASQPYKN